MAAFGGLAVACGGDHRAVRDGPTSPDAGPDGPSPAAQLTIEGSGLDFGDVETGVPKVETATVRNTGAVAAPVAPSVAGAGFLIRSTTCGATLAPGARCDVAVALQAPTLGDHTGVLRIDAAMDLEVPLRGRGLGRITIAAGGAGRGVVTSSPPGIDCGDVCTGLFLGDVVLTAAPGETSALGAWSVPGCGPGPTCTVTATEAPTTATVTFAAAASAVLHIEFAGDAPGEVTVLDSFETVAWCTGSCSVPVEPGMHLALLPATPFTFGGWDGPCDAPEPSPHECSITIPPGPAATATATFRRDAADQWTRLLPPPPSGSPPQALSVDFDGAGNLIVGTTYGLYKLSPTGDPIWSRSIVPGRARVDPMGDIFVLWREVLTKVSRNGAVLWSHGVGGGEECWTSEFGYLTRTFATAPNGDVAIQLGSSEGQRGSILSVWSSTGAKRWSMPVPDTRCAVAVSPDGVIYTAIDNVYARDAPMARRFASDGTPLERTEAIAREYAVMIAFSPDGELVSASSGYGDAFVDRYRPTGEQRYLLARDNQRFHLFIPNAAAGDASGFTIWLYDYEDVVAPYAGIDASWIDETGSVVWRLQRPAFHGGGVVGYAYAGVGFRDVAVRNGTIAVVGVYGNELHRLDGWVQTWRPPGALP